MKLVIYESVEIESPKGLGFGNFCHFIACRQSTNIPPDQQDEARQFWTDEEHRSTASKCKSQRQSGGYEENVSGSTVKGLLNLHI